MTKRDYQAIARAIYKQRMVDGSLANVDLVLRCLQDRIADIMAQDDPRFNRALFIEACETGKVKA